MTQRTIVSITWRRTPAVGKELPAVGVAVTVTTGGRISRGDTVTVEPAA